MYAMPAGLRYVAALLRSQDQRLIHEPGVVPVQVPGRGSWLVGLQLINTGPWTEAGQALPARLQAWQEPPPY